MTTTPAAQAQLDQLSQAFLDTLYEEFKLYPPAAREAIARYKRTNDEADLERALEIFGVTQDNPLKMLMLMGEMMELAERVKATKLAYLTARDMAEKAAS
jgi:hypothetical protein